MSTERYPYCNVDLDADRRVCIECGRPSTVFLEWLRKSREAQGLPMKITDPVVLAKVATILGFARRND